MSCDLDKAREGLENELWRRWSDWNLGEWALLVIQASRHFTYVTAHSPTLPSLYLSHNSFSNPSVASPTSQLILQSFFRFSYVTGFHLRHLASRLCTSHTSQLILQPFRRFTYVTAHSPTLPLLQLHHSSFSSPSFASLKSQVFTYVTWRAAHAMDHRFMRGIVTLWKWVHCLNPDASKQWLGPRQTAKVIGKNSVRLQSNVCLVKFSRCFL